MTAPALSRMSVALHHGGGPRWARRGGLVLLLAAVSLLGASRPSRAADVLVHTISASQCLPAELACATITQEWFYNPGPGTKQFTVYTTASGAGEIVPGSLEASMQMGPPENPSHLNDTKTCTWAGGSACDVDLLSVGILPVSGCLPWQVGLSAVGRALNDPLGGPLSATASKTQSLSICNDGTLTVL
jgi:hypothetical protein